MADENDYSSNLVPATTGTETAADIAAPLVAAVPWLGGPLAAVLSGISVGRKIGRVREAMAALAVELEGFEEQASKDYVHTEDFQELFERTLRQVADERSAAKRTMYARFLAGLVKSPGQPYEEQLRLLRTLEELQPDHLRILKAMSQEPELGSGLSSTFEATLRDRLPGMTAERIGDLASQLNDLRVADLTSLRTMMTYNGAQDLRGHITPYGQRFMQYIETDEPKT